MGDSDEASSPPPSDDQASPHSSPTGARPGRNHASRAGSKKRSLRQRQSGAKQTDELLRRIERLEGLLDVAKAMTAERHPGSLLELVVAEAKKLVQADRCTLWIVDAERGEMWTRVAHGLRHGERLRIPIGVGIAGQVAATQRVINIPDAYADPRFNRQVDRDTGYRTISILAVPMHHAKAEVTGVLQALNKVDGTCFDEHDEEIQLALGGIAASAIENAVLYDEVDQLFEGFVRAASLAIESRDPTTSGHSERVAELSLAVAERVNRTKHGPYAEVYFSREEMRELRYAALLHDFGKVGVREDVLTKAEKLYPGELDVIETRLLAALAQKENACLEAAIGCLRSGQEPDPTFDESLKHERRRVENAVAFLRRCNTPTVLAAEDFARLKELGRLTFRDLDGARRPLLDDHLLQRLTIPRGSLDPQERLEIESHVTHTYRFLSRIPWTRTLRHTAEIAYAHHERLDGAGYPRQLLADQIPLQSRILAIVDVFDALTAADRPYKRAIPARQALDMLREEAASGKLEAALVDLLAEACEAIQSEGAGA